MKYGILFLAVFTSQIGIGQITLSLDTPSRGTPRIFAKNVISTRLNERDITFSPDEEEIYYTGFSGSIFFIQKQEDGTWSLPEVASFSKGRRDIEPAFSPDGKRIYFSRLNGSDNDIFYAERQEDGSWSGARDVGEAINTDANEFYPSVANDGSLYYTAIYGAGIGGEDIWYASFQEGTFSNPTVVTGVSTSADEFNAFVDPDEEFMYFGSFGREGAPGGGDIYLSRRNQDGSWNDGALVNRLNTSSLDYSPTVSPSGNFIFFTSTREPDQEDIETSTNVFDLEAVLNRLLEPTRSGSDIYWIGE